MSTTLHVGNLSFGLGEEDLKEFFSKFGNVTDTYIVRRGGRPRGYGFVEFASTKEADNALAANGEELSGRTLNIELANGKIVKSTFTGSPNGGNGGNNNNGPRRQNNYNNNNNMNRPPRRQNNNYNNNGGDYYDNNYDNNYDNRPQRYNNGPRNNNGAPRTYNRGGRNYYTLKPVNNYNNGPRRQNNNNGPRRQNNNNNNGPRRQNNVRQPRPVVEKEKTPTTVYVSNLPFSFDEKELANVFNKYKVKTAHVVTTRNGRSRGYGFVEFETEVDQANSITEMDQFTVKGADNTERKINVKVALVDKAETKETTVETTPTSTN